MIDVQHTGQCRLAREKERTDRAAYEQRWPRYCRECQAEGGRSSREYRGECHGTPASEQVFNYCPHCVEQGICPRCGAKWPNENMEGDEFSCYACGRKEGDPGCPVVETDCGCYDDVLDTERPSLLPLLDWID